MLQDYNFYKMDFAFIGVRLIALHQRDSVISILCKASEVQYVMCD